jgi:hypothetical protein
LGNVAVEKLSIRIAARFGAAQPNYC